MTQYSGTKQSDCLPIGGVVAAAVTPCTEEGVPCDDDMRVLVEKLVTNGCDGVFVIGSTGEQPLLDDRERRGLTQAARLGLNNAEERGAGHMFSADVFHWHGIGSAEK